MCTERDVRSFAAVTPQAPDQADRSETEWGETVETETTIEEQVEAAELSDRVRVKELCLERCDEITCGDYEFPEGIRRAHWVAIVVVTLAAGAFAWAGFLL